MKLRLVTTFFAVVVVLIGSRALQGVGVSPLAIAGLDAGLVIALLAAVLMRSRRGL
ncbi:MAG TPA: hypothetical protein VIJ94_16515 [Caulobacteraceae bacterium]